MAHGLYYNVKAYLGRDFTMEEVRLVKEVGTTNYSIAEWNISDEKAEPTLEQLNALESQADELEALNQVYANRKAEYPSVQDLVVALYDTDDKTAIDEKRAEIKLKYPKPGA
jgi:glutathionyl-hydroquinone reductase